MSFDILFQCSFKLFILYVFPAQITERNYSTKIGNAYVFSQNSHQKKLKIKNFILQ